MDDEDIRALVRRTSAELGKAERRLNPKLVLGHVRSFRNDGFFFSRELVTPGGGHISMLLPGAGWTGRALALGVSGWVDDIQRDEAHIVRSMRRGIASLARSDRPRARGA
jgi:hypothetical protein